jgi:hypothetical protein
MDPAFLAERYESGSKVLITKNWGKFTPEKKFDNCLIKIATYFTLGLKKGIQATGEAFSPHK